MPYSLENLGHSWVVNSVGSGLLTVVVVRRVTSLARLQRRLIRARLTRLRRVEQDKVLLIVVR